MSISFLVALVIKGLIQDRSHRILITPVCGGLSPLKFQNLTFQMVHSGVFIGPVATAL